MKLIKNNSYLLLIDEEAEINKGDYKHHHVTGLRKALVDGKFTNQNKVIAYYPLTKEAKELDLPLLPNPFKNKVSLEVEIDNLINNSLYNDFSFREKAGFKVGYREAQSSNKQFSLEDIKKAIIFGVENAPTIETHTKMISNKDYRYFVLEELINKYVQSLSTQQLPKEFIPEYETLLKENGISELMKDEFYQKFPEELPNCVFEEKLKTITNSEGKEELVGTYKY